MGEVFGRYEDTAGTYHWADTETGEHIIKKQPINNETGEVNQYFPNYGWICPVCGRGLSPHTSVCPCKGFEPGWKVTC